MGICVVRSANGVQTLHPRPPMQKGPYMRWGGLQPCSLLPASLIQSPMQPQLITPPVVVAALHSVCKGLV